MLKLKLGANFAVFILFFGVAVIEAIQTKNWLKVGFWVVISLVFLFADNFSKNKNNSLKTINTKKVGQCGHE